MKKAFSSTQQLIFVENVKTYHNKKQEVKDALFKIALLLYTH